MPELPEVETTRRGIEPHVVGRRIEGWVIRDRRLRWPVKLPQSLEGQRIERVARRAKYLGLLTSEGGVIIHLGMSGTLRWVPRRQPIARHDHVDFLLEGNGCLRYTDPRRFGSIHFQAGDWRSHWLLAGLGPEPSSPEFSSTYLHQCSRKKTVAVKNLVMDSRIVVGVGNIYANEALFEAGIRPGRAAGRLTRAECARLVEAIRETLRRAIEEGGTTLRDFVGGDGRPGHFGQRLLVYGREGEPCARCGRRLKSVRIGARATVYCAGCQC